MILNDVNNLLKQTESSDRYSLFQLQCFVLGKEPTLQAKLHCCLRELRTRKKSIDAIDLEIAEQKDQADLIGIEIEQLFEKKNLSELEAKKNEIILRRLERKAESIYGHIEDLSKTRKNYEEECMFFMSAFDQLSKREALKPWDDPEVQKHYWDEKLKNEVNLKLLLRQLPDAETLRSVLALHDDSILKKKIINMLTKPNEEINKPQLQDK